MHTRKDTITYIYVHTYRYTYVIHTCVSFYQHKMYHQRWPLLELSITGNLPLSMFYLKRHNYKHTK